MSSLKVGGLGASKCYIIASEENFGKEGVEQILDSRQVPGCTVAALAQTACLGHSSSNLERELGLLQKP